MNIPINEDEPIAIPVPRCDIKLSVSIAIKEVFVMIGVFNTIYTLIIKPNFDSFIEHPNLGNIMFALIIVVVCLAILYAPLSQLLSNNHMLPIYRSETITDPSMLNNIIGGLQNKQLIGWIGRVFKKFKNPTCSTYIITIINNIIMTFYDTTRIIVEKVQKVSTDITSLQLTVDTICNNQIVFDQKLDQIKLAQSDLEYNLEQLRTEMQTGINEIKMMISSRPATDTTYIVM